jgi:FkbM family methyltransferase
MSIKNPLSAPEYVRVVKIEDLPNGLKLCSFPDGFRLYSLTNYQEAEFIYNEIVVKQEYNQYGLTLEGANCIFDVGANIGVYTLFVKKQNPAATVYSFEPIPEICDVLRKNLALHSVSDVEILNVAVGDKDNSEKQLVYYPHAAGNSTAYPEIQEAEKKQKALIEMFGEEKTKWFFESEKRTVPVRTLSSIIKADQITSIDFLKIDVEGEELAVLQGIEVEHHQFIKQIAIEVHNELIMKKVLKILDDMGFRVVSDTGISSMVGTASVFAIQK